MLSIDEAIAHAKEQTEIFGGGHKEFLDNVAEWLEELKALREKTYDKGYVQGTIDRAEEVTMARVHGYNKAIDDFEKMAKEVKYQDGALSNIDLEYIAERLKAGGEDGR